MPATLRYCALLAASSVPLSAIALIDSVLLADEPSTLESIMASDTDALVNFMDSCIGLCTAASRDLPGSVPATASGAPDTVTTANVVFYGD